jgi:hypothetical protein
VRAALRAEAERLALVRERAALWAWRESAVCEAARRGWRLSARFVACERRGEARAPLRGEALRRPLAFDRVDFADRVDRDEADLRVPRELVPALRLDAGRDFAPAFLVGRADLPFFFTGTPASRALLSPIAMACFAFLAPCLPSRTWWISSRTNSPACVLADLPLRFARWARSWVAFSGISISSGE